MYGCVAYLYVLNVARRQSRRVVFDGARDVSELVVRERRDQVHGRRVIAAAAMGDAMPVADEAPVGWLGAGRGRCQDRARTDEDRRAVLYVLCACIWVRHSSVSR